MRIKDFVVFCLPLIVYLNAIPCGFVFDDASAIKENQDLRPSTYWLELFRNDFWGTPMNQERSHKSYRPVTVLTFRWNYMLQELNPSGYHLVNVILHSLVSLLFYRLLLVFLDEESAFVSSLLFALHPVHTEAVTGVVGRAELLSAFFGLLSLLVFFTVRSSPPITYSCGIFIISLLVVVGTLCKEQCITFVAVLIAYDSGVHYSEASLLHLTNGKLEGIETKGRVKKSGAVFSGARSGNRTWTSATPLIPHVLLTAVRNVIRSRSALTFTTLIIFTSALMYFRLQIMGSQLPHFTEFDNPAAHAAPLTRRLTHCYLIPVNLLLLLLPSGLCADWTVGSLRLIREWTDPRNGCTVVAFAWLLFMCFWTLIPRLSTQYSRALVLAMAMMIFPFIPASNLLFPVGFVVAERVLYTPSLGFTLLFGLGYSCAISKSHGRLVNRTADRPVEPATSCQRKGTIRAMASVILLAFAVKTFRRNFDWNNEYNLFSSALKVNSNNAKMWNNVGHALEAEGRFKEALGYFQKAVSVQPNDIGARINVGRTYVNLRLPDKAEEAYFGALDYFPKPRKGETYYTRVAPKDLMVFINLANLYMNKTPPHLDEAGQLLRRAISLRSDFVDAYQNYGSVLIKQGRLEEAENTFRTALTYQQKNPDLHYNLGVVLLDSGRKLEGLDALQHALILRSDHLPSIFAMATTLTESKDPTERNKGAEMLRSLVSSDYEPVKVHFALAMLETDIKNFASAVEHYRTVLQLDPTHRSSLFNLALLLRNELQDADEAIPLLKTLIEHYPDHVKSYMLLGDIELTEKKNTNRARKLFEQAVSLAPSNVQAKHNLCVALADSGNLAQSEQCLMEAIALAPEETYLREHLAIVRKRMTPT
ncbi:Transmembrane and TPR repeat-containing protein 3 [Fasciolopsis buskii]|uniref:dolichyl-phosphate-mannose--protein mannosyltransferase n=1 Tax=Fasciolopsis buskii TaxID=27845 RepID=A0A8E0VMW6_9TREM|nr:Transmembrane and TPR repeat-containing protein 3 [Fasciolopsis buski]